MIKRLLVDTGPFVALFDRGDQHHKVCREAAARLPDVLLTAWPVVTETCYLLRSQPQAIEGFLEAIHDGQFGVLPIASQEVLEIGGWMSKYRDQQIDFADACLAYLANREGIDTVFTVDARHFSLFRTTAGDPLNLVPDLRT